MDALDIASLIFSIIIFGLVFVSVLPFSRRINDPENTRHASPSAFAAAVAFVSVMACVIAYSIGVDFGINFACSKEDAGNQCGLAGYFFIGPIFALVATILTPVVILIIRKLIFKANHPAQTID